MKPLFLLLALLSSSLLAAELPPEKTDLFAAGEHGFALYRIPGLIVTAKGTVLAYCEARHDGSSDWGEIEVHLRRSTDGGHTWEAPRQIAHLGERSEGNPRKPVGGEHEQTVNNPVAIADRDGTVHFLYCLNYARCFYQRSDDDGLTFSAPVEITAAFEALRPRVDWKCIATGPGHGIQLRNGRLLVPIWLAYGKVGAHAPSVAATLTSDDHGFTWHTWEIPLPNEGELKNPNETAAVELADGRVMLNARSQSTHSRRLVTISPEGTTGWTPPHFDDALWDPMCMGSLVRLPEGLLFSNPHTLSRNAEGQEIPGGRGPRENLTLQLSRDEGQTWAVQKTLEAGPSAYSDLATLPDGTILCFYERKNLLTLARFNLEWVLAPVAP